MPLHAAVGLSLSPLLAWTLTGLANPSHVTAALLAQASTSPSASWNAKVDPRSEATIQQLNSVVQPYARELVRRAAAKGIEIKVIGGFRTFKEQDKLYCQGRNIPECKGLYTPGSKVTNAKGGFSNHNFGIAFDIGVFNGTKYLPESSSYVEVGKIGRSLGLEWGGDWTTFKDRPHFQLRPQWAKDLSEKEMLAELRRRVSSVPPKPFYP
jgi:peptidoglycan L-alanyl-D-glutamate endopeptidase CwlK